MKRTFRLLIALACGAIVAAFAASPAMAAKTGAYAATAAGTGLSLSVTAPGSESPALSVDIGITNASLDSVPKVTGYGAGLVQLANTIAQTTAPPDANQTAALLDQTIGDPNNVGLSIDLVQGVSESLTSTGPATHNSGEVEGALLGVGPLVGVGPFSVASQSNIDVTTGDVTSEAHSDEVVIPVQVGKNVISPVCDVLGGLIKPVGDACHEAVDGAGNQLRVTVLDIRILPAAVTCVLNRATNTASVPEAAAALLSITLFPGTPDEQTISASPQQTIDLLDGTPLHTTAVLGDAATSVTGSAASATADALRLDLLDDPLPTVSLVASESSCAVNGQPAAVTPPANPPLPVTGAPLVLIYGLGGLMVAVGLGLTRFLRGRTA